MKTSAYLRVSTDEQAEKGNSLSEQEERLKAYCKAMGWDDPIFYIDDGYSAGDLRRPHLTRLLEDIKVQKYDIVLTTKTDRLCRKLLDILTVVDYLDKYDCKFVSSSEGFDTATPSGRMVLQLLGTFAEFERERIRERVRDNMISLAKNTDRIISRPCFGYDVIDGQLTINIEESLIVKKMADMTLEGLGALQIAKHLNEQGIKSKEGNQWHDKVVRQFLKRETLIGEFVYNRTYKKGTRILTRPEEEWIRIKKHHEPILNEKDFYEVQRILESRKTAGSHVKNDTYLLSGLIWCAHCGSKMNGKHTKGKNTEYYRYVCDGYQKKGICHYHFVHREELEGRIQDEIKQVISASTSKLHLVTTKPKIETSEKELIQSKLDKLDGKIQKQIEAYEEDLISAADLKKASERIEAEREKLNKSLNAIKEDKPAQNKVKEKAKQMIGDILSLDRLKSKNAIRQLIHKIEIKEGKNLSLTWYPD
jgi:site-specific DNA recombinase